MRSDPPRLALSQLTTSPLSFEEDLDVYEAAGHSRIELCTQKLADDPETARNQLRVLRDRGFTLSSVQPAVRAVFPDRMADQPQDPEQRLERYRQTITLLKEVFPDLAVPLVITTGRAPSFDFEEAQRTLRRLLPDLADFAAGRGLRLAFEPIHPYFMQQDTFIYSLDEAQRLLEDVGRPNVGLVLDLFHVWQEIDLCDRIGQLAHRIDLVHVSDWPSGGPRHLDDRSIPGEGQIDLPVLIAGIRASTSNPAWVLELLSDSSLDHSLWNRDPRELIRESQSGFTGAWEAATARINATAGTPGHANR